MNVILGHVRQVEIDDVRQLLDIEATRRDVGGDEHLHLAGHEVLECTNARVLALVAVDRVRVDAVALQLRGEAVGAVLGLAEHQHLRPVVAADEMRQHLALAVGVDQVHVLRDELGGRVAPRDFDGLGILLELRRELADLLGESRREEQVLPLRRQEREDLADVVDEAHVEHAIGFIEHQDLDLAQINRLLLHVVEQAAGRGDEDVDPAAQGVDLRIDTDPAVDGDRLQLHVLAVRAHAVLDLRAQLARWRDHQAADRVARGRMAAVGFRVQDLEEGKRKAGGLAGTGLGGAQKVFAGEHYGDGLRLDGGRRGVALLGNSLEQFGREPERIKRANGYLLQSAC